MHALLVFWCKRDALRSHPGSRLQVIQYSTYIGTNHEQTIFRGHQLAYQWPSLTHNSCMFYSDMHASYTCAHRQIKLAKVKTGINVKKKISATIPSSFSCRIYAMQAPSTWSDHLPYCYLIWLDSISVQRKDTSKGYHYISGPKQAAAIYAAHIWLVRLINHASALFSSYSFRLSLFMPFINHLERCIAPSLLRVSLLWGPRRTSLTPEKRSCVRLKGSGMKHAWAHRIMLSLHSVRSIITAAS